MNRNLIFVFIFFATLSVVNSLPHQLNKRETEWGPCYDSVLPQPKVELSEDPPIKGKEETFEVSGPIPSIIKEDDNLTVQFIDDETIDSKTFSTHICGQDGLPQCPIYAYDDFSVSITVTVPEFDYDAYHIYVSIGNPYNTLACAYADFSE